MPGKVKVKIIAGRNLPVMDRSSDTTDAYVEVKLGNTTFKTDVCRKSLNPQWNSEWYRFEVDDSELQDEPLQIRLMDHDTYTANDFIGKVYIDLNPLLLPAASHSSDAPPSSAGGSAMAGWIPVYDTMHGIRGEVNVLVKLELFSDFNKFRQSSCGVQFFCSTVIPQGYTAQTIHGFVEELVVSDDPEYQWIDKIRTPRASNEARQTLFFKISGEIQRKIGLKALDLGGNSVIGYSQNFDLEGESGVVARGIGTAVTLVRTPDHQTNLTSSKEANPAPRIGTKFAGIGGGGLGLRRNPHPMVLVTPRAYNRSFSADRGRANPILHRGNSTHSLKTDSSLISSIANKLHRGSSNDSSLSSTSSLVSSLAYKLGKASSGSLKSVEDGKRVGFRAVRLLRSLLPTRVRPEELSCVEEVSLSCSSSSSSSSAHSPVRRELVAGVHAMYADVPSDKSLETFGSGILGRARSLSPSTTSSSDSTSPSSVVGITRESSIGSSKFGSELMPKSDKLLDVDESSLSSGLLKEGFEHSSVFALPSIKIQPGTPTSPQSKDNPLLTFQSQIEAPEIAFTDNTMNKSSSNAEVFGSPSSSDTTSSEKYVNTKLVSSDFENAKEPLVVSCALAQNSNSEAADCSKELFFNALSSTMHLLSHNCPDLSSGSTLSYANDNAFIENLPDLPSNDSVLVEAISADGEIIKLNGLELNNESSTIDGGSSSCAVTKIAKALPAMPVGTCSSISSTGQLPQTSNSAESLIVDQHAKKFSLISSSMLATETQPPPIDAYFSMASTSIALNRDDSFADKLATNMPLLTSVTMIETQPVAQIDRSSLISSKHPLAFASNSAEPSLNQSDNSIFSLTPPFISSNSYSVETCAESSVAVIISPLLVQIDGTSLISSAENLNADQHLKDFSLPQPVTVVPNLAEAFSDQNTKSITSLPSSSTSSRSYSTESCADQDEKTASLPFSAPIITTHPPLTMQIDSDCQVNNHRPAVDQVPKNDISPPQALTLVYNTTEASADLPTNISSSNPSYVPTNSNHQALPLIQIHSSSPFGSAQQISAAEPATEKFSQLDPFKNRQLQADIIRPPLVHKRMHDLSAPLYNSACKLTPVLHKSASVNALESHACAPMCRALTADDMDLGESAEGALSTGTPPSGPAGALRSPAQPIHRRSSDSDLSITPKGGSLTSSERSCGHRPLTSTARPVLNQEGVEMLEYPFLTMSRYPPGFLQHMGGTVSARSVKLLERINNLEEPETRDAWWTELRMEVRSHARALACNVVVGYSETTTICDDVCVLSASGTAAVICLTSTADDVFTGDTGNVELESPCSLCHVPYAENSVPFRVKLHRCAVCRRGKVPDVLFTTIDLVDAVATTGEGSFIHAYVARPKRDCKGEMNAKEISDGLPFLEYDLHRLLMSKLKVKGMNAVQGLKVQICIGEKLMIGLATGTAALLSGLPAPRAPKLSAGNSWKDRKKLADMQKLLIDSHQKNLDFYNLHSEHDDSMEKDEIDVAIEDLPELDFGCGNKDACILEVDDAEDADLVSLLTDPRPPEGFHVVCTEAVPGLSHIEIVRNLQMFTHVWRAKIPYGQPLSSYNQHINRLVQSVVFKLRNTRPVSLSGFQLKVTLEQDEVQLSAFGMALGLGEPRPDPEAILTADEPATLLKPRKHMSPRSRYGVDITPLSFVPGGTIERYLGNLNFFFIRESSCIREGGGLSGFMHNFLMEVLAVVRAHVTALGGNALVAYFMSECFLFNYPHKNQGQCLINVGGDAVFVSYFPTNLTSNSAADSKPS